MPRVAGIIVNLVPYHHARWEAFTRSSGAECHVVELTDQDAFKVLEFSATASYQRHTLFPESGGKTISVTALRRAMAAKLDAVRPDVVCVSGWALPVSLAGLDWATRNQVPVVMLSESNEWDDARSAWREAVKRRIVGLCSAALVGGTPQTEYLAKLGLARERIYLGYDAVDNGYFGENAEKLKTETLKAEIRRKYGLPENYFLACCRFGQKKNVPRLVEAFAHFRKLAGESEIRDTKSTIWDLMIVGDGELRPEIESAIARFGVGQSVHLVGAKPHSEIPTYYGLANAFIHASTTEQWGLVVNEAMASGLPVLVSNRCGCARDLVQDGVNGFTFDPYDMEQLAQLMLKISAFQDVRLSEFGAASQRIVADWGPERFATGLQSAVRKALAVGPIKPTLLQRMILKFLLNR